MLRRWPEGQLYPFFKGMNAGLTASSTIKDHEERGPEREKLVPFGAYKLASGALIDSVGARATGRTAGDAAQGFDV